MPTKDAFFQPLLCSQKRLQLNPHQEILLLSSEDLNSSLQRSKALLHTATWGSSWLSENQLSTKSPGLGNVPGLSDILANAGVEVLQVAAEAFGSEGGPDYKPLAGLAVRRQAVRQLTDELVHAVGVFVPCLGKEN